MAAAYLDPPPRDFTRAQGLTLEATLKAIREGRPDTAMRPFGTLLEPAEIAEVAAFVQEAFVRCQSPNNAYHTTTNGWPDHRRRYATAFPFVRGELSLATAEAQLDPQQRAGRRLFLESCITCHEPRLAPLAATPGRSWVPLSATTPFRASRPPGPDRRDQDDHDDHDNDGDHDDHAEGYEEYGGCGGDRDQAPRIASLTAQEALGAELYADNCAFCHAADGRGKNWIGCFLEPHPTDLTEPTAYRNSSQGALASTIRDGVAETSMPAFGSVLSEEQVDALVAYLTRAFLPPPQ